MIDPKSGFVNSQITDAVAATNTCSVGQAPALTQGLLDAVMAQTLGLAMHNAVTAQQNAQTASTAAVTATCARLVQARPSIAGLKSSSRGSVEKGVLSDFAAALEKSEALSQGAKEEIAKLFAGNLKSAPPKRKRAKRARAGEK